MAYEIIPENQYLNPGQTYHLTPTFFNQIFANINAHSMSNALFLRPVQVVAEFPTIFWKPDATGAYDAASAPQTIELTEVGSDFMPEGWTVSSYTWTPDPTIADWLYDVGSTSGNRATLALDTNFDASTILEFKFFVAVVYTDPNGVDITTSAHFALPVQQIKDGVNAIDRPVPIINIPTAHEPLSAPGGRAIFTASDVSWLPATGTVSRAWSLADHNGVNYSSYITDTTAATPTISIPTIGKNWALTLTLTESAVDYSTTSYLSTYDYGSFLFSSWGSETPVDAATAVKLTPSNITVASPEQILPLGGGHMEVKWGKDMDEISRLNGANSTNDILTIPGFSTDADNSAAVQSLMNTFNLPQSEDVQNYSIVELNYSTFDGETEESESDLIGQFFWTTNMNEYAEILYKAPNSFVLNNIAESIANNNIYLVKGIVPYGIQTKATIGPGSERYYIHLKHYDIGPDDVYVHVGKYDQYATVVQSTAAAPVEVSFKDVPIGSKFKASVTGANGSAYSGAKESEAITEMSSANIVPIASLTTLSQQYGLEVHVNLDPNIDNPIGYLVSYVEMDPNVEWPADSPIPIGALAMSQNASAMYFAGPTLKIPAGIGNKVGASVYAVMADGSVTSPINLSPITVSVPWSYLETGLSKHLGRLNLQGDDAAEQLHLDDVSIIDDTTAQHNLTYTSFGRDVFIETVIAWVHMADLTGNAAKLKLQSDGFTDANDEKEMTIGDTITGGVPENTKYLISNLSIPIPAGSDVILALQNHTAADKIDLTLELHYSNGIIVTSSTPVPDDAEAGGGSPL